MSVILALILVTAVGLALQFLISGRISTLASPLAYTRKCTGWVLFATSIGVPSLFHQSGRRILPAHGWIDKRPRCPLGRKYGSGRGHLTKRKFVYAN